MKSEPTENDGLRRFLSVIRRRALIVVLATVLVPVAAYAFSASQDEEYSASATLLFKPGGLGGLIDGPSVEAPPLDSERAAATTVSLASLDRIAQATARRLGTSDAGAVQDNVSVSAEESSDVVTIHATGPSGQAAATLANIYAEEFVDFRRNADLDTIRAAERRLREQVDKVNRRLARLESRAASAKGAEADLIRAERASLKDDRANLLQSAGRLRDIAALNTGDVELVQRAAPSSTPTSPRPRRDAAIGLALGLLLGIGLAFLFELLDRRLKAPEEVEAIFGRPIVATIPHSRALANPTSRRPGGGELAAFQMLRANLYYFNVDRNVSSVLVTSPEAGDGKSTVSWFFAAAAAEAGRKVLLIEAELRRPSFVKEFGLPASRGLSDVLQGHAQPGDVMTRVPVGTRTNGTAETLTMDVLAAGAPPGNPSDLMESERMATLLREAENVYDLVVIDTPPTPLISDAVPLVSQVDGVLVVLQLGKSTRDSGGRLQSQLENLNAPILGVVLTNTSSADGFYGTSAEQAARYADTPARATRNEVA